MEQGFAGAPGASACEGARGGLAASARAVEDGARTQCVSSQVPFRHLVTLDLGEYLGGVSCCRK